MSSDSNEALWIFASGLYQQEAVKKACLRLQDSADANVNIVLWLAWLATLDIRLQRSALTEALQIVGGGHTDLLKSLRQARSHLQTSCSFTRVQMQMIRKHILAAELSAEKVMLQRLQELTGRVPRAGADVEPLTLFDYLQTLEVSDPANEASFFLEQSRFFQANLQDSACTIH